MLCSQIFFFYRIRFWLQGKHPNWKGMVIAIIFSLSVFLSLSLSLSLYSVRQFPKQAKAMDYAQRDTMPMGQSQQLMLFSHSKTICPECQVSLVCRMERVIKRWKSECYSYISCHLLLPLGWEKSQKSSVKIKNA